MPIIRTPAGAEIAWHDLGGSGEPVLLSHATGFHAHVWLPVAQHLAAAGFHCYGFDERGHGDSPTPADGDFSWNHMAGDLLGVIDAIGLDQPFGVGHSAGGALLLLAEEADPGRFRSLYVYEPVVFPIEPPPGPNPENPLAVGALRRRETFPSRDAAYENYASKPPFSGLAPAALRAYVDYGFDDLPDGTVRLKCRGADESMVYTMAGAHDAYVHLDRVRCPVTVACGELTDALGAETVTLLAHRLGHGRTEVIPDAGHFAPLEQPDETAARIVAAFRCT